MNRRRKKLIRAARRFRFELWMRRAGVLAALVLALPPAVQAQDLCATRDAIVRELEKQYGETQVGAGLDNSGAVMELYASPETGTWTLVYTLPTGVSCLVASGVVWRAGRPVIPGEPG